MPRTAPRKTFRLGSLAKLSDIVGPSSAECASIAEYDARVDAKKRVTIRNAKAQYFRVTERKDGTVILKPRVSKDAPVPARTVRCIAKSIASMKAGKRSAPEDLKKLAAMKI